MVRHEGCGRSEGEESESKEKTFNPLEVQWKNCRKRSVGRPRIIYRFSNKPKDLFREDYRPRPVPGSQGPVGRLPGRVPRDIYSPTRASP